jgi:hypothetical protein
MEPAKDVQEDSTSILIKFVEKFQILVLILT